MKPTVSLISEEHQRAQNYIEALQNKNTATILSNLTFPTAKTGDFGTIFETNSQAI